MVFSRLLCFFILGISLALSTQSTRAAGLIPASPQQGCNCTTATCLSFADTMKQPVMLTGTLIVLDATDANNQPYRPYALKLPHPVCVRGNPALGPDAEESRDAGPTDTLQLAGEFNTKQAKSHINHSQTVRGTLFAPNTGWHVTPVLIDVRSLTNPPRR